MLLFPAAEAEFARVSVFAQVFAEGPETPSGCRLVVDGDELVAFLDEAGFGGG